MNVRTEQQLREHYEIERGLADRLRAAGKDERRALYGVVYSERAARIPHHPLVVRASQKDAQAVDSLAQLRLLKPFLRPSTMFVEIGAGDCALSIRVAEYVRRVVAVEVSSGLVKGAQFPANCELRLFDGFDLPVGPAEADLIYSRDVVEHLHPDDLKDQMASAYKVLRPGGKYICVTPNRLSGPWDISRSFDDIPTGFHLKEYTSTELANVFTGAGFSKVKVFLSYKGYHLSPILPLTLVAWGEAALERCPRPIRRAATSGLVAVKVMAIK